MVLRVWPTPTRFPTNSLYTPVDIHTLAFYIKCVPPVERNAVAPTARTDYLVRRLKRDTPISSLMANVVTKVVFYMRDESIQNIYDMCFPYGYVHKRRMTERCSTVEQTGVILKYRTIINRKSGHILRT